jgi:hypothetical protein
MEIILTENQIKWHDPTRTTALRRAFVADMKRRFRELAIVVKKGVDDNDCFGLKPIGIVTLQMTPAGRRAFEFARNTQKIEVFMQWLQKQVEAGIVQVGVGQQIGSSVEAAWMNMYILDSYKRGLARARLELQEAGIEIPSIDEAGGLNMIMNNPFHMDRVGVLFTRTFTELKGITAAMDQIISRILAQGIIDGDGPALLAKKLVSAIEGMSMQRAVILARTEIIRAFHLATIQEYRNWGLLKLNGALLGMIEFVRNVIRYKERYLH